MHTSNEIKLSGRITETKPIRFTPAGVPVLELTLEHESKVVEGGLERHLNFMSSMIAIGHVSKALQSVALGQTISVIGFLATSKKGSSRLRIHVQSFELIKSSLM